MNKLFTKIAGVTLGFAMAIGVGVAVAGKQDVKAARAEETTTTYVFTSKSWETNSANWTSGKDGGGFSNNGIQVTTTYTGANGTSPISFTDVSKVVLTYNTNKSGGAGTAIVQIGDNTPTTKDWAYSTGDGRTANYTLEYDYATKQTGNVKITLNTTKNSIYLVSCAITTSSGETPTADCASIQLTGAPTEDMSIGDQVTLGYYALDTEAEEWTGDVKYTISNESSEGVVELSATSGDSVTLTAKKAGTATVSVQDADENADADSVVITVLEDPERIDLPTGDYTVTIDAADETSASLPSSRDYEIKDKEGRTWYKNLTAAFSGITVLTNYKEYESAKTTGCLTVTNNSNAVISNVVVHYYKFLNEGVGIYVGDEMLEPTSSTGTAGTDNDLYRGYTNITGNTFALKNGNADYTSKYYSVTISLTVADESEEFDSLEVSKSTSWSKMDYKDGQAPSNEGLIVTAKFTTDGGETISRTQDVTSLVSAWAYNPTTLHTGDTSFSVVATWEGHDSAAFVVTGINVTDIEGPIASGRYYIMTSDFAYGLNAAASTEKSPAVVDMSQDNEMTAFDVTLVGDNEYTITTTIEETVYYLVANTTATSGTNSQLRITSAPVSGLASLNWSLFKTVTQGEDSFTIDVEGAYFARENTVGAVKRYLSMYNDTDWRAYANVYNTTASAYNGNPQIQFVPEGSYAAGIVNALTNTLTCDVDGKNAPSTTTWSDISDAFGDVTIAYEKNILKNAEYTISGSGSSTVVEAKEGTDQAVAEAVAKYDYIVGKYNKGQGITTYNDFLNRDPAAIAGSNYNLFGAGESNDVATIVVIIAIASISAFGCLLILKKRKHQ